MGSDYSYAELSLGALYPLADDDTTPYFGGGLSLSGVGNDVEGETDEGSASGLGLYASAGVILGRSSSVSIRPELSYLVTSYEVNDALVHGLRFSLSLGFPSDANQNTTAAHRKRFDHGNRLSSRNDDQGRQSQRVYLF